MKYSGMAVQMGVAIGLGVWAGMKLDAHFGLTSKAFTITFSLLAVGVSMFLLIKSVMRNQ